MCGISLLISKNNKNIISELLSSLNNIQNRGYDSIGVCYNDISNNKYKISKYANAFDKDCFDILTNSLKNEKTYSGFGHTRWATHGTKNDNNSHPHTSMYKNIVLVHNGIITNYLELKEFLIQSSFTFKTETDTEVIANLLEYYILYMNYEIEEAIKKIVNVLQGTWALVILYTKDMDTYYITRKGSPLLIGESENYIITSSEINGFAGLIYNYSVLNNNDIIKVNKNGYSHINNEVEYEIKHVPSEYFLEKKNYDHWMLKEINEQPETIKKAFNNGGRILNNRIKLGGLEQMTIELLNVEFVLLFGCGTSYHAGLIGEIYFNNINHFKQVKVINACEFNENQIPNVDKEKILAIFLTQSGETIDLYYCLEFCKNKGINTMGIVNKVDSLIAREVDCGVYLNAGIEMSVASTKSFTSMLIVLMLVSLWFSDKKNLQKNKTINIINNLRSIESSIIMIMNNYEFLKKIDNLSQLINKNYNNLFILGKDEMFSVALEGALKIKEVTYLHCEGFSAAALKHGPFSLLDKSNLTILLIGKTSSRNFDKLRSTYNEIKSRDTNLFLISNYDKSEIDKELSDEMFLKIDKLDYFNEILFTIVLQYLSYKISLLKNINPDKPRNLAKVVTVE